MTHYYQFVNDILPADDPDFEVELDLDDIDPFYVSELSLTPPKMRRTMAAGLGDGDVETGSSYESREIRIELAVKSQYAAEDQAAVISRLTQILDRREGTWLKMQSEAMDEPRFFRTYRASPDIIDSIGDATPDRTVTLVLPAKPGAYGLPIEGTATITNDPTAVSNPMMVVLPEIEGDLATDLHLTFDTPDAAHRILVASQAVLDGTAIAAPYYKSLYAAAKGDTPSLYDLFARTNSALTMGVASPGGGTWDPQAGVWGIDANRAYCVTGVASDWSSCVINFGSGNVVIRRTIDVAATGGNAGLLLRSSNLNTGIAVLDTHLWDIAFSATIVGPTFSETFVVGDVQIVAAFGTSIKVFRQAGGTGPITEVMSTTTSLYQTNTKHGLTVFGTAAGDGRFDNFGMAAATGPVPVGVGWTITDAASATAIGGTRRTLVSAQGHSPLLVPTSAVMQTWAGLPIGDYRVMVRIGEANAGTELLFWNKPPKSGTKLVREEAAASALVVNSTVNRDWYDLGIVSMPGGAPLADPVFGLDGPLMPALWNFGVYNENNNTLHIEAIVLIPAARPRTLTRHSVTAFPDTYTSKTAYLDGINNRRYAEGENVNAVGTTVRVAPTDLGGALPKVLPGPDATNVLHFFATAADPASESRLSDSKTLTTVVNYKYLPIFAYERPAA